MSTKLNTVVDFADFAGITKEIPIFKGRFAGVVGIDFLLDFSAKGKISSSFKTKNNTLGITFVGGAPLFSPSFRAESFSFSASVSGQVGIKARAGFLPGIIPFEGYIYAEVGGKARAKATVYTDFWTCTNIEAWLFVEAGCEVSNIPKFIYSKASFSRSIDFYHEGNSPLKCELHYDNGRIVSKCTRGSSNTGSGSSGNTGQGGSNSSGGENGSWEQGTVTVSEPPSNSVPFHNPTGYLDLVQGGDGKLRVAGWAFDYDSLTTPLQIHVYVGGTFREPGKIVFSNGSDVIANQERADVPAVYNNSSIGNYHGFDYTFDVGFTGTYPVYVYAINVGERDSNDYNTLLTQSPMMVTVNSAKQTCQTPEISISEVYGGKKIRLSSANDNTIFFKIQKDGSEIVNSSSRGSYETLISSEGTYKVSAYSARDGYNDSGWITRETHVSKASSPVVAESIASDGMLITMQSITNASKILYTLDGSLPDSSSTLYTGSFIVDKATIIRAITTKNGYANSEATYYEAKPMVPSAPTGLVLDGDSKIALGETCTVSWDANTSALSYTASLYKDDAIVDTSKVYGTTTSFRLAEEGIYQIKVSASNFFGNSEDCADVISVEAMAPSTVEFKDWDGSIICEQQVPYGSAATIPADPERRGYSFVSWDNIDKITHVTSDLVINAKYRVNIYSVKFFDPTGVVQIGETQKVEYGKAAVSPEDQITDIPTGYVFAGWRVTYASLDSAGDYHTVDSDMNLSAVYLWENNDLPIVASIESAIRNPETGNYNIAVSLTNFPDGATTALLRVSLLTKAGKMVKSEKATVEVKADGSASVNVTLKYSGVATIASAVVLGLNGDDKTGSAYSKEVTANITTLADYTWTDWTDWSETRPEKTENNEIEEKIEYRFADKSYTTSSSASMNGWTMYNQSSSWSNYGEWSGWSPTAQAGNDYKEVQTRTEWRYYYFYCPVCGGHEPFQGTSDCHKYSLSLANAVAEWFPIAYCNSNSQSYSYTTAKRWTESLGDGQRWNFTAGNLYDTAPGTQDYGYTGTVIRTTYRYRTRTLNTTYYYYKWNDWSAWGDQRYLTNDNRKVEERTIYRSREKVPVYSELAGVEDEGGEIYSRSGTINIDTDLNGKLATIMVYKGKNTDPNEDQLQFVGQTIIGENNRYSFEIRPKQEPTSTSGDYTICLGIEGSTGLVNIGRIEAPKRTYRVVFMDNDGQVISAQEVKEGENALYPANPSKDGYRFTGWNKNAINIQGDMLVCAQYEPIEYVVAFVDGANSVVSYEMYSYGEQIVEPEAPIAEGRRFVGWDYLLHGNSVVTSNLVLFAVYEANTYTVEFLDENDAIISTQDVAYGQSATPPAELKVSGKEFLGWSTSTCWWKVTEDVKVKPLLSYLETTSAPVYDIVDLNNSVAVYLESTTENADIYYSFGEDTPDSSCEKYDDGPIIVPLYRMDAEKKESDSATEIDYSIKLNAVAYSEGRNDSSIQTIDCSVKRVYQSVKAIEVKFDSNGGVFEKTELLEDTSTYYLYEGQELGGFPDVVREGYVLVGWFTNVTGGEQIISGTEIYNDLTLYAHWIECAEHGISTIVKNVKPATCTEEGYSGDKLCKSCGQILEKGDIIPASGHQWDTGAITQVTTTSEAGIRTYTCINCGETRIEVIPVIVNQVIVNPVIAEQITISKKPSIKKPVTAKTSITVKWSHFKRTKKKSKSIWKKIKKVQIQCATDKGFRNSVKTINVGKNKTKASIKGLTKNSTYFVRVRYFDGIGYSRWSRVKKLKTKK